MYALLPYLSMLLHFSILTLAIWLPYSIKIRLLLTYLLELFSSIDLNSSSSFLPLLRSELLFMRFLALTDFMKELSFLALECRIDGLVGFTGWRMYSVKWTFWGWFLLAGFAAADFLKSKFFSSTILSFKIGDRLLIYWLRYASFFSSPLFSLEGVLIEWLECTRLSRSGLYISRG